MRIRGPLNVHALHRALQSVVDRHEALRSGFGVRDSEQARPVSSAREVKLPIVDVSEIDPTDSERIMHRIVRQEIARPFELRELPLIRAMLVHIASNDHVWVLTSHQVVADASSIAFLMEELDADYQAALGGLPPLSIQSVGHIGGQRSGLTDDQLAEGLAYWTRQLHDAPEHMQLPTDRPRVALLQAVGEQWQHTFSCEDFAAIKAVADAHASTPFMTLLAGLAVLLSRYTGQLDMVLGSTVSTRSPSLLASFMGSLANVLALRVRMDARQSFGSLLTQVRDTVHDATRYQDVPLERLLEAIRPGRGLGAPLFQVIFDGHASPQTMRNRFGGLTLEPLALDAYRIHSDLEIHAWEYEGGMELLWLYDGRLFDAWRIEQMGRNYVELLMRLVRQFADAVNCVPLPGGNVLGLSNETAQREYDFTPIHELIERVALTSPDAIALTDGHHQMSYGELNRRANQLGRYLMRLGVQQEVRVGICLRRSLELVVALLGTLKSGAAYVPLDPDYPSERIALLCEGARVPVLITSSDVEHRLPSDSALLIRMDTDRDQWEIEDSSALDVAVDADNLAYVIYTSGSTGQPKGVCVSHRGVCNLAAGLSEAYAIRPGDVMFQFASFSFDAFTTEWTISLRNAAKLAIPPPERGLPGRGLEEIWDQFAISVVTVPPSVLASMRREPYCSIHTLAVAGERCPQDLVAQWSHGRRFLNAYGPTEITVCATISAPLHGIPDIGGPIPGIQLYVLDSFGHLVPIGVVGELYIGGAGVARGYLDDPRQTAERFIPNLHAAIPGERVYRTGDLVRVLADRRLEYVGRVDHQVKIRGCRIEPGEVEAAIASHPAAGRVLVLPVASTDEQLQLIAYVIKSSRLCSAAELIAHARVALPAYMAPAKVCFVDTFPLTPNGKIDRRALSATQATQEIVTHRSPRTPMEALICEIWAEVLKRAALSIDEDFFASGGHSLLAARAVARIERVLQRQVPVVMFFDHPTVAQFAAALDRELNNLRPAAPPIARREANEAVLSFGQQRLWFLDRLTPDNAFYVVPSAVRLRGSLRTSVLRHAVQSLVDRHAVLRTSFLMRRGQPRQVVAPAVSINTPLVDLSALDEITRERTLQRIVRAEAIRAFSLVTAPLVRSLLLRVTLEDHVWLITMHHIVADAWSMNVLTREVSTSYRSALHEATTELSSLPVQYSDYAVWQRAWLSGPAFDAQVDYWLKQLRGAEALNVGTDRPRPRVPDHAGGREKASLSASAAAQLRDFATASGVTIYMVMLAAWQVLLARYAGQSDVLVGTPMANRSAPEVEGLIGFFVNTLVMRTDISGNPTFREALDRVRETAIGAFTHQDVPFELLVEQLQPERDLSRNPIFQVLLQVHEAPLEQLQLPDVGVSRFELEAATTRFDLELHAFGDPSGGLQLRLIYSRALFDASTVARMLAHFVRLLDAVVLDPNQRIEDIALLAGDERDLVLRVWNASDCDWARAAQPDTLATLVMRQAVKTPDRIAMVSNGNQLTYGELMSQATRIAATLREKEIGPDSRVGVCVPRGFGVGIAILGVTLAGAAYVPLDPSYPPARLLFMARDAALRVVITQGATAQRLGLADARLVMDVESTARLPHQPSYVSPTSSLSDCIAYIMYTSGSTGTPKGIALPQSALLNLLHWYCTQLPPAQRTLQLASISFDASFHELFHAWTTGGTVVCVDDDTSRDVAALARIIETEAIEKIVIPALLIAPLTQRLGSGGHSVADIVCTAEPLQISSSVAEWFAGHRARLHNHYGPSESHVVTSHTCSGPPSTWPASVPIGRPTANTQLYILDRSGQPVPIGVVGELYIGGVSLARGYQDRPDLTAQRFVPDPFGISGARLYRTGDRVRYRPSGELEFLGRCDHQTKIRGFRIEPNEIESVLTVQPEVAAAVVIARELRPGDRRLIAYIVPKYSDAPPASEVLRERVRQVLPAYMVPSAFVLMSALPVTPSGKVDRQQLPTPDETRPTLTTPFAPPRTRVEQAFATIWSELLRVDRVGVDDDFFDLGGHSLLAAQFVNRVEMIFDAAFPLREVFERPTIRQLAHVLREMWAVPDISEMIAQVTATVQALSDAEVEAHLREVRASAL